MFPSHDRAGVGFVHANVVFASSGSQHRMVEIRLDLGSTQKVTSISVTYNYTQGTTGGDQNGFFANLRKEDETGSGLGVTVLFNSLVNGSGQTQSVTSEEGVEGRYVMIYLASSHGGYSGSATIVSATVQTETIYGDAFYTWSDTNEATPYDSGEGLTINASSPTSIPSYNESSTYQFSELNLASGPVVFDFNSPHPVADMTNWSQQLTVCFLGT